MPIGLVFAFFPIPVGWSAKAVSSMDRAGIQIEQQVSAKATALASGHSIRFNTIR
jgi:hypothetical protein